MTEQEFAQALNNWKQELLNEVIIHYRNGNEERGNVAFTRWEERFIAFLREYVPYEADHFRVLTYHIALVAIPGEDSYQQFMRESGKNCLAFIDDLSDAVQRGRVRIQEKSLVSSSEATDKENLNISKSAGIDGEPNRSLITVITALEEELDYLFEIDLSWSEPLRQQDGISYRRGHLSKGVDIIATSARSMGLVATAILTAKVLKEWVPSVAAMIGVCAGRKERSLNIGDVVIANQCFHYQFGAFVDGRIARELRVENIDSQVTDLAEHLILRTEALLEIQKLPPRGFKKPNTILQGHIGPMASADLVVKDVKKLDEAVEADRKTIAVDMESYAFMRACKVARTPHSFVIKSVSDFADAKKDDEFREYAKLTATQFFYRVAQKLVES